VNNIEQYTDISSLLFCENFVILHEGQIHYISL
jgi:hypothetical protein